MSKDRTDKEAREKTWDMIKDIKIAHLVTHADKDRMSARPMQHVNREFDGSLWFFTSAQSPKIQEISENPHVLLIYSNPSKQDHVSVQAEAVVLNDRAKIAELWAEPLRIWFPEGKDDMNIRLIRADVKRAEYWDTDAQILQMIYGYAKASITGEIPDMGENRKVSF